MITLAWGNRVSQQFRERVIRMAERDGYDPSHAMAVMYFESKLDPQIVNPRSGATGLIQFMPSTARDLNTTVEVLRGLSAEEQLDYVDRYFHRYAGKLKTLSDTYMAVLWPKAVGQPEDYVLFEKGSMAYEQNKELDTDNDGKITKQEATAFVAKALAEGLNNAVLINPISSNPEVIVTNEETEVADPVKTIAGVASVFNPMVGGLIGLAGEIFKAFSPVLQAKVAKEINRHTDNPEVGTQIAGDLAKMVMDQAKVLTGQTDDFKAAAAITQPAAKEDLAKIEAGVEAKINQLKDVGDKASIWDQALWNAQNTGRQVVSTIAIEEKRAGLYDMTQLLARSTSYMVAIGTAFLLGAILFQSMAKYVFKLQDAQGIDPVLVAFAAPLITIAFQCWKDIIAYRFDGTKESSDQSKVLLKATK